MGRIIKKIVPYILMVSILFSGVFGVFGILGQNEKQIAYAASAPVPPIQGINSGLDKVPPTPSGGGCSLLNLTGCIDAILAWVGNLVLWTMARLVWLTGGLLFFVMKWNLQINELLKSLPIVDIGWKLFRDMANMLFIFALLWIAISTIIGRGGAM